MKRSIEPVHHPYWLWEEVKFNMWGNVEEKGKYLQKAIKFTGNHKLYGKYMLRVAKEWTYSCEHNLTINQNRQAWIGHAAVALAFKCPEHITRQAWWYLTPAQQDLANKEADKAINYWEKQYVKNKKRQKRIRGNTGTRVVDIR